MNVSYKLFTSLSKKFRFWLSMTPCPLLHQHTVALSNITTTSKYAHETFVPILVRLARKRTCKIFANNVNSITDTWSRQNRVTIINFRGVDVS